MASSVFLQASIPLSPSTARPRFKPRPTTICTHLTLFPSSILSQTPHIRRLRLPSASATATASESFEASTHDAESANHEMAVLLEPKKEKLKVGVKTLEKPRLVLKFIWMEKNIGLGLDQIIPGHGCVPLSPYYFWPRKDAWEELKAKLEEKPWISQKCMVILLNQATDIINLWQQAGGSL